MDSMQDIQVGESTRRNLAADLNRELVQLYRRYAGRGPTKARTTVNTNHIFVQLEEAMTPLEVSLLQAGREEQVEANRRELRRMMSSEAVGIVERLADRRVRCHAGGFDTACDIAIEAFMLERVPESGEFGLAESSSD